MRNIKKLALVIVVFIIAVSFFVTLFNPTIDQISVNWGSQGLPIWSPFEVPIVVNWGSRGLPFWPPLESPIVVNWGSQGLPFTFPLVPGL